MTKLRLFPILLLLVGTGLFAQNVSLDQAIQTSTQAIETRLPKGAKTAVLTFTSAKQAFSDYIIDELATALSLSRNIQLIDRQHTDAIRKEFNIQFSGDVSDDEVKRIGHQLGAQYVVTGSLVDTGPAYRFRVAAINIETNVREGSPPLNININDPQVVFLLTGQRANQSATIAVPANFVHIQGGTFIMGSPSNEPERLNDETQHQVTVSSFYMGIFEVTQKEWYEVMGTNPGWFKGGNLPVEQVSWYDAVEYCNRRSGREGLTPAYTIDKSRSDPNNRNENDWVRWLITWNRNANGYRLPTEAEWEYACRAGTVTPFSIGNNITISLANYNGYYTYNNNASESGETTEVGSFAPNLWGLFDMHGNVWEWCWDWKGNYSSGAQTDPRGAVSGSYRVQRGGSWVNYGQSLRSASRGGDTPSAQYFYSPVLGIYGFRLVRNAQ